MAVIGSILLKRTLKQFLKCKDLEGEKGVALTNKLRQSAKGSIERLLEVIPEASQQHAKVLRDVCLEYAEGNVDDLLVKGLDNDLTQIRSTTASILSQSSRINPSKLFSKLHESDTSKTEIIDILSFQQKALKPEQIIVNALKLERGYAEQLLKLALGSEVALNLEALHVDPLAIESQSLKIALLRYFSQVEQAEIAVQIAKFLTDENKTIVIEALKALKNLKMVFDASVLLPFIETMTEVEREMAIEIIRAQATTALVPRLAPWTTGKSNEIREAFIELLVEHVSVKGLEKFLLMLDQQEWWGKEQAIKCLHKHGSEKLYAAAAELAGHDNEFLRGIALQLSAQNTDPGDLERVWENALDENWQLREAAIETIGKSAQRKALAHLKEVLAKWPESAVSVLRAVGSLGFSKGLEIGFSCLKMPEALVQREALEIIGKLATERYAGDIRDKLMQRVPSLQTTVRDTAGDVVYTLTEKFHLSQLDVDAEEYFATRLIRTESPHAEPSVASETVDQATQLVHFQNIEELKEGDVWMDRFRISKEIGRGAMGRVMLTEDEMVGETLILKFMHPELTADGASRERFLREVKYSRKVSHQNVIRIHDLLFKDNLCAISMEYFNSRGVDEVLREKKFFQPREGLEILLQVSNGMAAAHKQDVIHRDLKPSNILIDDTRSVKVVDFGIASASANADSTLTKTGSIIGTPAYLSPERAKGKEAHQRCDIYSLGIIAYYMFTGRLPYRGEPMSLLFQHLEGKAPPAHEVKKSIDVELSNFIQKMMAVEAADRYQSMEDVSAAIEGLLK